MTNDTKAKLITGISIAIIIAGTFYLFDDYLRPPYGADVATSTPEEIIVIPDKPALSITQVEDEYFETDLYYNDAGLE